MKNNNNDILDNIHIDTENYGRGFYKTTKQGYWYDLSITVRGTNKCFGFLRFNFLEKLIGSEFDKLKIVFERLIFEDYFDRVIYYLNLNDYKDDILDKYGDLKEFYLENKTLKIHDVLNKLNINLENGKYYEKTKNSYYYRGSIENPIDNIKQEFQCFRCDNIIKGNKKNKLSLFFKQTIINGEFDKWLEYLSIREYKNEVLFKFGDLRKFYLMHKLFAEN